MSHHHRPPKSATKVRAIKKRWSYLTEAAHTCARVTQIMDLNLLAPDIQEAILDLPRTIKGRDPVRERHVRAIAAEADWAGQRELWRGAVGVLKTVVLARAKPDRKSRGNNDINP